MVLAQQFPYYISTPEKNCDTLKIIALPECDDKEKELEVFYLHSLEEDTPNYSSIFIANFSESVMKIKFTYPFYGLPRNDAYFLMSGVNATFHYEEKAKIWFITG